MAGPLRLLTPCFLLFIGSRRTATVLHAEPIRVIRARAHRARPRHLSVPGGAIRDAPPQTLQRQQK